MTFAEARRAIYIDFECVKEVPALLGLLVGADAEDLTQVITDERLAPARVAKKRCQVAAAPAEVGALVSQADTEARAIVGWSFFDRDRLIDARPDLEADIKARYVNALQIARPWRRTIHPDFPIERADQHAPRHTLDKYAALAGYADVRHFSGATPAKWIRHTLAQLRAAEGRYRRTTSETKRDWHKLLEYNRHDCLALRHIVLRASREMECWHAYEKTRFCVQDGSRQVCFLAGSRSARLDALLHRHGAEKWAFLTAWNPASVELTPAENDARQRELVVAVESSRCKWLQGEGVGQDPSWSPEKSLLVLGISAEKAIALGRRFGQLAVVVGRRGGPARLVGSAPTPTTTRASHRRRPVAG